MGVVQFDTALANAEIDGVRYENGKVTATADQLKVENAQQDVNAKEEIVYETKTEYVEFHQIKDNAAGYEAPVIKPSALKTKDVTSLATFISTYKDKTLTDADKAEIARVSATYETQAAEQLQTALNEYETALTNFATVMKEATANESNAAIIQQWQQALTAKATTVAALQTEVSTFKDIQFNAEAITKTLNDVVTTLGGAPLPELEKPEVTPQPEPTPNVPEKEQEVKPVVPNPVPTEPDTSDVNKEQTTPTEPNTSENDEQQPAPVTPDLNALNEKIKANTDTVEDYIALGINVPGNATFFKEVLQPAIYQASKPVTLDMIQTIIQDKVNVQNAALTTVLPAEKISQFFSGIPLTDSLEKMIEAILPSGYTVDIERSADTEEVVKITITSPYELTYEYVVEK